MTDRDDPRPALAPAFTSRVPRGDDRHRLVCDTCGFVNYVNPRIVVGSVVAHEGRILLCRRAIEPRRGFWTLPAGFLEEREDTEAGARREAREEALAEIEIEALLAIYNVTRISQVQIMYKARLAAPDIGAGPESLEVALFDFDAIPWQELAFPTVHWALRHYREIAGKALFAPFANPVLP